MDFTEPNYSDDPTLKSNSTLYANSTTTVLYENFTESGTFRDDDQIKVIVKIIFDFVLFPLLTFIGLFGNTSTIVLFFLKKQKTAAIVFIIGLAISDLIYITVRLTVQVYLICEVHFTDTIRYVRPRAFFWILLSQPFQKIGFLFVLVITIERVTAVWFPFKLRQIWTTRRSLIVSAVVVLLPLGEIAVVIDYLFFSINEGVSEQKAVSTFLEGWRYIKSQGPPIAMLSSVYRVIFDILPLPLVLIFNILIILGIRKSSFSIAKTNQCKAKVERSQKEARMTKMLLTISMLFVLLCGPYTLFITLSSEGVIMEGLIDRMVYEALHLLMLSNNVINFIVYGVSDSSLRKSMCKMCGCQY